ncbi:NAD(P)H-binding protein [Pelagibacteraceae bacterium]|nr:NAD(P)H-binding protein [Pelagibacteraceae bacterium]
MKTAVLFGSSGLVGNYLLELLLENKEYKKIKIFTRKIIYNTHPKVEIYKINFNEIDKHTNYIKGDDCFFAIGTTRKLTPKKEDYINTELNLPIKIAKIAKTNNITSFTYVSSGGANSDSNNLYLQNKGKAEKAIIKLSFKFTAIIQPSLLLGNRKENRMGERMAKFIFKKLSFLFVGKLKPFKAIHAKKVACAIININQNKLPDLFFTSDRLEDIGS